MGPLGGWATPRVGQPMEVAIGAVLRAAARDRCPLSTAGVPHAYIYAGWLGELLTPLTFSHFDSPTHSLASKFLSSIFQQVLV